MPASLAIAAARPPLIHIVIVAAVVVGCVGAAGAPTIRPITTNPPLPTDAPVESMLRPSLIPARAPSPQPIARLVMSGGKFQASVEIGQVAEIRFTLTNKGNASTGPLWIFLRPTDIAAIVHVAGMSPPGGHVWFDDDIGSPEYSSSAIALPELKPGASRKYDLGLTINDLGAPVTLVFAVGPGPAITDGIVFEDAWEATTDQLDFQATIDAHF